MHIDYDGTILVSMLLSAGGGCFACPKSTDAGMLLALRTCYCACATFADVKRPLLLQLVARLLAAR